MKVCVLFNPKAGSAGQMDAVKAALAGHDVVYRPAESAGELGANAATAAAERFDVIAVAGGDGTVHAAVNGLAARFPKVPLLILPLGTGNDLCRTLGIPLDPVQAVPLLTTGRRRRIDVVRVDGAFKGVLVNAATGGFSGKVATEVTSDLKAAWGPLAYLRGAVGTVVDPPTYTVTLTLDKNPPVTLAAMNVVIANGRTAAGGVPVAPLSNPEDGKVDVVVVKPGEFFDRATVAARLMAGEYTDDEFVLHRTARRVLLTSDPPMPFSVDGELTEGGWFEFTTQKNAVRVLAGPAYRRRVGPSRYAKWGAVGRGLFGTLGRGMAAGRSLPAPAAAAALAVLAFLLVAWALPDPLNLAVRDACRAAATPTLDALAETFTWLGGGLSVVVAGGVAAWQYARGRAREAGALVAVVLLVTVAEMALKPAFGHARPGYVETWTDWGRYSFPSGHALRSVGVYGLLAVFAAEAGRRWLAAALLATAALVCGTRVWLGVHWLADVLAGATLATASVGVALAAARFTTTPESPPMTMGGDVTPPGSAAG